MRKLIRVALLALGWGVDSRAMVSEMPDAPEPVRNSLGDIVGSWTLNVFYDEASDRILLVGRTPGGQWRREGLTTSWFRPEDIEDAIAAAQVFIRTAGARRLF